MEWLQRRIRGHRRDRRQNGHTNSHSRLENAACFIGCKSPEFERNGRVGRSSLDNTTDGTSKVQSRKHPSSDQQIIVQHNLWDEIVSAKLTTPHRSGICLFTFFSGRGPGPIISKFRNKSIRFPLLGSSYKLLYRQRVI